MRTVTLARIVAGALLVVSTAHAKDAGWKRYFDVKRVGTELAIKENVITPENSLGICSTWSSADIFGTEYFSAHRDALLLDIAGVIVEWRHTLGISKKQKEDWDRQLEQVENRWVSGVLRNSMNRYAWDRDADRESKRLAKAFGLSYATECGAGGYVDVKFRTQPKSGQVSVISEFDYELCKLSHTQNNHELCTAWRVAKEPEYRFRGLLHSGELAWPC